MISLLSTELNCCLAARRWNERVWKHVYVCLAGMQMIDDSQMIQVLFRLPNSDVLKQESGTSLLCFDSTATFNEMRMNQIDLNLVNYLYSFCANRNCFVERMRERTSIQMPSHGLYLHIRALGDQSCSFPAFASSLSIQTRM